MRQSPGFIRMYGEPVTSTPVVVPTPSGSPVGASLKNILESIPVTDHSTLPGDYFDVMYFDDYTESETFGTYFDVTSIATAPTNCPAPFDDYYFGFTCLEDCLALISYTFTWEASSTASDRGVYQSSLLFTDSVANNLTSDFHAGGCHDQHEFNTATSSPVGSIYGWNHSGSVILPCNVGNKIGLGGRWHQTSMAGSDTYIYTPTVIDRDCSLSLNIVVLEDHYQAPVS